ncbi:MAG: tyrosine-type recombinase/integrase [Thermoanaerobaculia bacterium]
MDGPGAARCRRPGSRSFRTRPRPPAGISPRTSCRCTASSRTTWGLRVPSARTRGQVDLDGKSFSVSADVAKNFKAREVPLSDLALELLARIRPAHPAPADPVFLGPEGERLRSISGSLSKAVKAVCPKPKAGERFPTFHSLRKTCATALEAVASKAVAGMVLGHSDADVTDLYIKPSFEDALAALNRAALLIDGEEQENVAIFRGANGIGSEMAGKMANGRVSA